MATDAALTGIVNVIDARVMRSMGFSSRTIQGRDMMAVIVLAMAGVAVGGLFAVCRSERHLERMTQRQTVGDGLS